jgi:hypothetical protein
MTSSAQPIHPQRLVYELDRYMNSEDDIIIADGGDTHTWVQLGRTVRKPYRLLDHGLFGCIGWRHLQHGHRALCSIPTAACPGHGDGSWASTSWDQHGHSPQHALRHRRQQRHVLGHDPAQPAAALRPALRLRRLARRHPLPRDGQVHGRRAISYRPDELPATLDKAFASKKVALINVHDRSRDRQPGEHLAFEARAYKAK